MQTSFSRPLALALGLHAVVALAGRSLATPAPETGPRPARSDELGILVETEPERQSASGVDPGPALGSARGAPTAAFAHAARRAVPVGASEASVPLAGAGEVGAAAAAAPSAEGVVSAERPVDLGLGGLWARPALPDRPKSAWRSGAEAAGGLGSGLEARDQARGLGRGGVVASLARGATISRGPSEGVATFRVLTDRQGKVTNVTLGEARGGSWDAVLSELRRSLGVKRLRVPPGSNGLAVDVVVRATVQLPSGARPGQSISGRGAGVEFDVADVAAHPTRVVSARVASERLL